MLKAITHLIAVRRQKERERGRRWRSGIIFKDTPPKREN